MPVTLRRLVADRSLNLGVRAGEAGLDRPIAWVHSTELIDPTPFMEGGELLLTTGLALSPGSGSGECAGYIARLAAAGAVGLGFGTGLSHATVPVELSEAAEATRLPLFEVPRSTPFIAISKAVSAALAADRYAALRRTNDAQHVLTRAAIAPNGLASIADHLSRLLGAWVLLLDHAGHPDQAAPASAADKAGLIAPELDRLRAIGTVAGAGFTIGTDQVSVQTLGARARGFLAIGRPVPLDHSDRQIANAAAALMTLALEQSRTLAAANQQLRTGLFHLMAAGQSELARRPAAELWGPLPTEPVQVYALAGPAAGRAAAAEQLEAVARDPEESLFFAEVDPYLVVLASAGGSGRAWLPALLEEDAPLRVGVGDPVGYETLPHGYRQATLAVESVPGSGAPVTRFADLAGQGLLRLLPGDQARGFAEALLAPLLQQDEDGRAVLVTSLRVWLEHHGQWDPAAVRLGVHRHTLRNRMRKVELLTGRSLDVPGYRAELWFALQLLDEAAAPIRDDVKAIDTADDGQNGTSLVT